MTRASPIGIKRIEALSYYVHDLERTRRFLTDKLDFAEIGASSPEGLRRAVVRAGQCAVVLTEPTREGGRAWRFLRRHPEGIGMLTFEVQDAARAFALIEERGGTPITDLQRFQDDGGHLAMFSITTPFGDTTFEFVERDGYRGLFPGLALYAEPRGGKNQLGFGAVDHVTSNFQTMAPALLWLEHVLGFERYWEVKFHTRDVTGVAGHGSGLKSVVMWDPRSGVKFAHNEPYRPHFKESQIHTFSEEHRGDGVQHVAITTSDIVATVRGLRARGVEFMPTPGAYYDMLPERLERTGVGSIDEDIETLRELEILVDGGAPGSYLLQIFLRESAGLLHDPEAGPFFFEIIQRKGDEGFGAGNFRALFESIEREQRRAGRAA
jgi:4-hydroxyphenylpyruvate dioxygenase